jgi:hypothetical protein
VNTTTAIPTLPTPKEYAAADEELARLLDIGGSVHDAASRVFKAINYEGEQTVTYADVGALCEFAHWLKNEAEDIAGLAKRLERVALVDLCAIRDAGAQENVPSFNQYGMELSDDEIAKLFLREKDDG